MSKLGKKTGLNRAYLKRKNMWIEQTQKRNRRGSSKLKKETRMDRLKSVVCKNMFLISNYHEMEYLEYSLNNKILDVGVENKEKR